MIGDEVVVRTLVGQIKGLIIEESVTERLIRSGPVDRPGLICQQQFVDSQWHTIGTWSESSEQRFSQDHETKHE